MENNYGFVKMKTTQKVAGVICVLTILISFSPPLVNGLIFGVSASQWLLAVLSLAFPIVNVALMMRRPKRNDEGGL